MLQRQKKKDPPQDYTGQLFRRNFQRLISSASHQLILNLCKCQRNIKFESKRVDRIVKFKNVRNKLRLVSTPMN